MLIAGLFAKSHCALSQDSITYSFAEAKWIAQELLDYEIFKEVYDSMLVSYAEAKKEIEIANRKIEELSNDKSVLNDIIRKRDEAVLKANSDTQFHRKRGNRKLVFGGVTGFFVGYFVRK